MPSARLIQGLVQVGVIVQIPDATHRRIRAKSVLAQVAARSPAMLLPRLGKRKRSLSGLPAQAAYAKHARILAVSAKIAEPEPKTPEPPKKLVKYYRGKTLYTTYINLADAVSASAR